ncbi:enoyl-CoA hydratase/isomerase family protein [Actinocorallia longicatena]|uniref:Enoyl-CoA hydratase/isomerase family protein n=1 Tax=Actinocorallia longicatena TaxID=111803 RepID=A0ABP6QA28_9ACTN
MTLRWDVADGVATVRIDNQAKRNAMNAEMWRALPELLAGFAKDPAVRMLVLTGAGEHFCAGADISELTDINKIGEANLSMAAEDALANFPKPTIAAIRGFCVGGGCQLAAACDLRIAAPDARFAITPAKIGIVYPSSAIARLVGLVGPASAKYLLYTADLVPAEHALRIGFLSEIANNLDERIISLTGTLTSRSQFSLEATKDIVNGLADGTLTRERTRGWLDAEIAGPDAPEGIAAFLERRPPRFTWRRP